MNGIYFGKHCLIFFIRLPIENCAHQLFVLHPTPGINGELYITVGSNTNAGKPGELSYSNIMRDNFFSAALLVANLGAPGFNGSLTYNAPIDGDPVTGYGSNGVEIFAPGLRNPYGVVMHSNGYIYATDNGPNPNFGDMATGCGEEDRIPDQYDRDELNRLVRGNYYGHANMKRGATDPRQCVWRATTVPSGNGYTAPMMRLSSSTNGIIEFDTNHFNGQLRGNLILSKYKDGLFRVILSSDGLTVQPTSNPAISLTGDDGLALTQAPNGNIVDARYDKSNCHVFTPVEIQSDAVMVIKAVFPRRGSLLGGTTLHIFGINFSGSPTVTVGGEDCLNVDVSSSTRMKCILPAGTLGAKDVVVTIGETSDSFTNGYRYITGVPV